MGEMYFNLYIVMGVLWMENGKKTNITERVTRYNVKKSVIDLRVR